MSDLSIQIKLIGDQKTLPAYAFVGDAGLDLSSTIDYVLAPFERALIPTGIAVAIPHGYAGLVVPRSGLALRQGLSVVNAPGLIDSEYRGEIKVIAVNLDETQPINIQVGDRIAQLLIIAVPTVTLQLVESLDKTQRGEGGFGSSGI